MFSERSLTSDQYIKRNLYYCFKNHGDYIKNVFVIISVIGKNAANISACNIPQNSIYFVSQATGKMDRYNL